MAELDDQFAALAALSEPAAPSPVDPSANSYTQALAQRPEPLTWNPAPDPELQALAARAEQAPPPPTSAAEQNLAGAMMGNEGDRAYWERQIAGNQPFTTSRANPLAPIVDRQVQEFGAGDGQARPVFEPTPFRLPARLPGETDVGFMERVDLAKMAHDVDQQEQAAAFAAQSDIPAARDIGRPGEIGFNEAERRIAEDSAAAQTDQAERMAAAEVNVADAKRAAIGEARAQMEDERNFQEDQRDALVRLQDVESAARAKLEAMPELDGQRYSQSRGLGAKIFAVLGSIAGGWRGDPGAIAAQINTLNERDLEEQRLNHEIGVQEYDAAKGAVSQGMNLYGMLENELGDPAAAADMFLNLADEDAMALLSEEMAKTNEPVRKSQIQQELVALEQGLRARRDQMAAKVATTPRNIVTKHDPGREDRRFARKMLEADFADRRELRKEGVDIGMEQDKQQGRLEVEGVKRQAASEAAIAKEKTKAEADIKKNTANWGAVEKLVSDFLDRNPDNIHGVGAPLSGDQNDRIRTRSFMNALELLATDGFTGAAAADRQVEQIRGLIEGDWTEVTDDAFRTRMGEILNIASSQRRYLQSQLGSDKARINEAAKELKTFKPR